MTDSSGKKSFEDIQPGRGEWDWLFRAEREMFPQMKSSAISLVIGTDKPDAKLALEVGAAVLFGKPLLIVIPQGREIPAGLRKIATMIVEVDDMMSPEAKEKIGAAVKDMLKDLPR